MEIKVHADTYIEDQIIEVLREEKRPLRIKDIYRILKKRITKKKLREVLGLMSEDTVEYREGNNGWTLVPPITYSEYRDSHGRLFSFTITACGGKEAQAFCYFFPVAVSLRKASVNYVDGKIILINGTMKPPVQYSFVPNHPRDVEEMLNDYFLVTAMPHQNEPASFLVRRRFHDVRQ